MSAPENSASLNDTDVEQAAPIAFQPKQRFFELRLVLGNHRKMVYGLVGAIGFFAMWELGHHLMDETQQKFLPSVTQVLSALWVLLTEKAFLFDIYKSCYRVFVSFFAAAA